MTSSAPSTDLGAAPIVSTEAGRVRGTIENGSYVFRGIPYAEPPVGRLRFRPPAARQPWDGVWAATRFGERHQQDYDPVEARLMKGSERPAGGEDCLNLNVWTPDLGAAGLPVMVWIHGGSLKFGAGSDAIYDGTTFARDGMVTVTLNYRLHPAGFLYIGDCPGSGAFGLLDQIAALGWVRENISAFGGDPDRVTVAGESAGAYSVGQLLAAPAARGLFGRAILQSGAASFDVPVEAASVIGSEVLHTLGVRPGDDDALAAITSSDLLAASRAVEGRMFELLDAHGVRPNLMSVATRITSLSTYGGDVMPQRALTAVADGAARGVDLLMGTNLDEFRLFPPAVLTLAPVVSAVAFGPADGEPSAVLDTYRQNTPDGSEEAGRAHFLDDTLFRIPSIKLAEAAQRHHARVYQYLFAWGSPPSERGLGAFHALDVPFMWDRIDDVAEQFFELAGREPSPDLASAMHGAWVSFVQTGAPRHPGLPEWPAYDTQRRATMRLDAHSRVVEDPLGGERRLWDAVQY
jgi:carboxylesterase type B